GRAVDAALAADLARLQADALLDSPAAHAPRLAAEALPAAARAAELASGRTVLAHRAERGRRRQRAHKRDQDAGAADQLAPLDAIGCEPERVGAADGDRRDDTAVALHEDGRRRTGRAE